MHWLRWFRRKKEPARLKLYFEYTPGCELNCYADWPTGLGKEADQAIVEDFSQILALLGTGKLMGKAQQAVAVTGQKNGANDVAFNILNDTNAIMNQFKGIQPVNDSDEPIIPATRCFPSSRNQQGANDYD